MQDSFVRNRPCHGDVLYTRWYRLCESEAASRARSEYASWRLQGRYPILTDIEQDANPTKMGVFLFLNLARTQGAADQHRRTQYIQSTESVHRILWKMASQLPSHFFLVPRRSRLSNCVNATLALCCLLADLLKHGFPESTSKKSLTTSSWVLQTLAGSTWTG